MGRASQTRPYSHANLQRFALSGKLSPLSPPFPRGRSIYLTNLIQYRRAPSRPPPRGRGRQRTALHPPTHRTAPANAPHCICQRTALHPPTHRAAPANAPHCIRQRMPLVATARGLKCTSAGRFAPCLSLPQRPSQGLRFSASPFHFSCPAHRSRLHSGTQSVLKGRTIAHKLATPSNIM